MRKFRFGVCQILVQWVLSQIGQILIFGNGTKPCSDLAASVIAVDTADSLAESFLCQFFRTVQRAELLTYVLDLISEIVKEENSFFTLEDIKQLLISTKEIRSTQESVLYIGIISSYWQFQYYLCERYVVFSFSLDL